ncbi:glucosamine-6-phosphate deaminase [Vagococcus hydrophili]|uniref:Glucosamine-6-phosphate deaminase n=1 Tax=Vagococcus hydrophili TaxID=2714947 RepID=A0A6G8AQV5_9ENTE|nr:glucosamine-6-phosphate deaminase [Vagococcus hydrophili]QIL47322.1 glucosamine-6-phosphate deaminase [Vagococcus hydrophili]
MRVIITKNYEELGKVASQHLLGTMFASQERVNLAITAGRTPLEVYKYLVPEVKDKNYLNHVHYYNFDEIPYKDNKQEGITIADLRRLYLNPANVLEENIHVLDGENYENQDNRIQNDGGLDSILLGVGADGHYCGNLPNTTTVNDYTSKVTFEDNPDLEQVIIDHFIDPKDAPDFYVTMGPRSIMSAKQLVLIANGREKSGIMKSFIEGEITPDLPVTYLKLHPNLVVIMDEEAASELN